MLASSFTALFSMFRDTWGEFIDYVLTKGKARQCISRRGTELHKRKEIEYIHRSSWGGAHFV